MVDKWSSEPENIQIFGVMRLSIEYYHKKTPSLQARKNRS